MIKAEALLENTFEALIESLNHTLRMLVKENGENCVISVSHSPPDERMLKFSAVITYKEKS